jgi:hypothetical protein
MPTFDTPEPIQALIDAGGVTLTVNAVEHATSTTVEVSPHNPARSGDVQQADRTVVELTGGRLSIGAPRSTKTRLRGLFGNSERIDVTVSLPAESALEVRGWGDVRTNGTLGPVDIDSGMGDITLDRVGAVRVKTAMGEVRVGAAAGPADLRSSAGTVSVGHADGEVTAKTSAGDVRVEEGQGDLRLSTSYGDVRVQRASAGVTASTSAGDVRLNSVCSGHVDVRTSYGKLEIGIAHGTAAWLDVNARHGVVRSDLADADGPGDSELTVRIHAVTGFGDIILRRA